MKNEVISHLIINLHKYNKSLGFKAYSYFGTSAKNYLIMKNRSDYLKTKINFSIDDTESNVDGNKKEFELEDHHIITNNIRVDRSCFIEIFSDYIDKNINIIGKNHKYSFFSCQSSCNLFFASVSISALPIVITSSTLLSPHICLMTALFKSLSVLG